MLNIPRSSPVPTTAPHPHLLLVVSILFYHRTKPWWTPPLDGPALEFGCGTGCLTMALRDDLGDKVTGVDTSRGMLDRFDAKAEGKGVTTVAIKVRNQTAPVRLHTKVTRVNEAHTCSLHALISLLPQPTPLHSRSQTAHGPGTAWRGCVVCPHIFVSCASPHQGLRRHGVDTCRVPPAGGSYAAIRFRGH